MHAIPPSRSAPHRTIRPVALALLLTLPAAFGAVRELKVSPPAGGEDAVPVLRRALERCRAEGFGRLVLEPGTWQLHSERAEGAFRHISNHDPGYRRLALHVAGLSDFEIDGQGSTLLCHGVLMPIAVDGGTNVTLRNLTIEWDRLFHLEGTVSAVGADYFDVQMLPASQVELRNGMLFGGMAELFYGELMDPGQARQDFRWNYWIDPATKAAAALQPKLNHWNPRTKAFAEVSQIGTNHFRIRNAHLNVLPAAGSVMVCKGMNRQNRLSPAIHVSGTAGLRVENITIHHAGGMGLIAEDCADVAVKGFRVALKEGAESLITTTADATHFVGCRGTVRVEECFFENMLDDSCNVHGVYAIAEELLAPDQLAVSFSHFQQLGTAFAHPGDRLRLIRRDTLLGYAECTLKGIVRHNEDYYVLTLDQPIDGIYQPGSSVENLSTRPDVVYRNNVVRNNRARSLLVTSGGKVLVENNRFERPSMMAVLIEGDNQFWYESGSVEDLLIRNNVFIGHSTSAPLFKIGPMQPGEKRLLPPYHRNIRILDNTIVAASPLLIDATRVAGLEFSGNKVEFAASADPAVSAFRLNACEGTVLRNNAFDRLAKIESRPPETPVVLENNQNLAHP